MVDAYVYDAQLILKRESDMKEHSDQIGRLCTLYSGLELDIAHCLIAVAKLDDPLNKNVFIGALDMRAKLGSLLAIGCKRKPSDDWFSRLSSTINTIDNNIRNERNRLIHDYWFSIPDDDGVETLNRVTLKAKVKKEPPSGQQKLYLAEFRPVTPDEISGICDQIIDANVEINRLRREFELSPMRSRTEPLPVLPKPPKGRKS